MPGKNGIRRMADGRPRLSLLADPIGPGPGGNRFIRRFVHALLGCPSARERLGRVMLILSQGTPADFLGPLPSNATVVRRRFPFRLRHTGLASVMGRLLPGAEIAHGLSLYVFPGQGRRSIVTIHDAAFMHEEFQAAAQRYYVDAALRRSVFPRCDAIVCISDTVRGEVEKFWPDAAEKCVRIYWGTSPIERSRSSEGAGRPDGARPRILAVGTIEPRKNYGRVLDAYEQFLFEKGAQAPDLAIVGRDGWMCDAIRRRLEGLEGTGKVSWLRHAGDSQLAESYSTASVFTYLSLYEGFGYPPFEAAYAGVPMVLSDRSAVGEIWSGHARCVDPTDVRAIVAAWKWAIRLTGEERRAVVDRQRARAMQFDWGSCAGSYLDLYAKLDS
jgi:glycosyltransferase involved in cell wall biosynthesis